MKRKSQTKGGETARPVVNHLEFPPPEVLEDRAMNEPSRKLLYDYLSTIKVLHDTKGFSFREIAVWLVENGIQADYQAVYRVYTKGMSAEEEQELSRSEAEKEGE